MNPFSISIILLTFISGGFGVSHLQEEKFETKNFGPFTYIKWEALEKADELELENVCVRNAGITKNSVEGVATITKHIDQSMKYHSSRFKTRMVRLDILQCDVMFSNRRGNETGSTTFFLAEGSEPGTLFKLVLISECLFLVGEVEDELSQPYLLDDIVHIEAARRIRHGKDLRTAMNSGLRSISTSISRPSASSSPSSSITWSGSNSQNSHDSYPPSPL